MKAVSQSVTEELKMYCQDFSHSRLVQKLDDLKKQSTVQSKFEWSTKLEREIIDNHVEKLIEVVNEVQDKDNLLSYSLSTHTIKLIYKADQIVCYSLIKIVKYVEKREEWLPIERVVAENSIPERLHALHLAYKKTYHTNLNFKELFVTDIIYGRQCGFAEQDPAYREKLNKLIATNNKKEISKWMKSATAELQLYAIEGIYALEKKGVQFDPSVLALLPIIEKKEGTVHTCAGCVSHNKPIQETVNEIRKEYHREQ
jgi:hypothetical protein